MFSKTVQVILGSFPIICKVTKFPFIYRLWESQVDQFLRQPTLSALHSVVQILAFGMALAKLVPEKYIQKLGRLSGKLIDVERKLQSSGLVPKAHFFSMREVVDLSPMVSLLRSSGCVLCNVI